MALDRGQFRRWCEDLNGGRLKQERGELVCEDPAIDRLTISAMDSLKDHAALFDMNSEPYDRDPQGDHVYGLYDGTVYRDGDTVVVEGNSGVSGGGMRVKVELPESETAVSTRSGHARITTDDLPRVDDPWESWLEENYEVEGDRIKAPHRS